jgi:LAO/AO transport system kinase
VGKSTLTDALVTALRAEDERVAVLAVDPTSPVSGGALLGDRIRMGRHDVDPDVFVRSMASRGHLGGLARAVPQAVRVLAAAGFAWVLVETVGVGQVEVAIAAGADTTVVVVNPGWGDGVQVAKAGLIEIADVLVVNKADRDGVAATVRDLAAGPGRAGAAGTWVPPIVPTIATAPLGVSPGGTAPDGIAELLAAIGAHRADLETTGELIPRRERRVAEELRGLVVDEMRARADAVLHGERFEAVVREVVAGTSDLYTAATSLAEGIDAGGQS